MNKINANCIICGEGYHCCISCQEQKNMSWRLLTDTSDHFKIYLILCDYRDKKMTKEVAKEQLSRVDITGWESFKDGVKNLMMEILAEDEVVEDVVVEPVRKKKLVKNIMNSDDDKN